jgi:hypothetical protein
MLWFENARRLDSAISPKAVLRNLPKLRHVFGVNYFFPLTTTISPYQRQLLIDP